ncbi:pyridoxal phosphate-dependent aminotransferase [Candidatus Dependentiae bacterium]|nr:pyridoxal phosphate-dependent aminotransferase [Candidatus Dependentiae bacterium]
MRLAKRMERLGTESAFEVLAKAKALEAQGKEVVHLQIGEPDFDTPANITEAAIKALKEGKTHYGPSAGLPAFRKVIAEYISETRKIEVKPEEVVVTPGGKPVIYFALTLLVQEGDEVIYPNPGYPIYESVINFSGAKAIPLPLLEKKNFRFEIEDLKNLITPRTKAIVINSPQNPTGGLFEPEDLKAIADICIKNDIYIFADEIYSRIIYGGEHHSILSVPGVKDRTIMMDGFSKTYAMTGWRLGYGIMPVKVADQMARLMTNVNSCTATFTQIAGMEGLTGDQTEVENMVKEFGKRRDIIVDGMNSIDGFRCNKPKGAFYVFPNIEGTGMRSKELADYLLEEGGVAGLSGAAFGKYGEGFLRFSYANSVKNIEKAIDMIKAALKKR